MRKKRQMQSQQILTSVDIESIREATRRKFEELLTPAKNSSKLAKEIDKALHNKFKAHTPEYKSAFRRLYLSLKKNDTGFKELLVSGELNPADFALKSAEELKTSEQQRKEEDMKKEAIRNSTVQQLLPENVNQVKDGRDREKWGRYVWTQPFTDTGHFPGDTGKTGFLTVDNAREHCTYISSRANKKKNH
ncbi:hypothetical protein FF38_11330 [Lucilia cuprina]|uniref:TFIIS central domain-containing protein n=1 Tax=Lucilia cuprina TaxID=7375 RepID=A0A0L0CBR2_LUCCU|nr:hypothetical protein FF38_11330 [Lucilia cuprina]